MSARDLPDARGHFDRFGGRFVPEALQAALSQLTGTFEAAVTILTFSLSWRICAGSTPDAPLRLQRHRDFLNTSFNRPVIRCESF